MTLHRHLDPADLPPRGGDGGPPDTCLRGALVPTLCQSQMSCCLVEWKGGGIPAAAAGLQVDLDHGRQEPRACEVFS